jgi:hypothetical protein
MELILRMGKLDRGLKAREFLSVSSAERLSSKEAETTSEQPWIWCSLQASIIIDWN